MEGSSFHQYFHIEVLLLFLSLRDGSDLGRSRIVTQCFDILLNAFFEFLQFQISIVLLSINLFKQFWTNASFL